MTFQYQKVKSVSKYVLPKGEKLEQLVLSTMKTISDVVGATLGPGGQPVLLERQEHGLGPAATKDGVTVFRSLGFQDSAAQVVLEASRDAAVRTAQSAGDGTTTATILAEALIRHSSAFVRENPRFSPQKVVRKLESVFRDAIKPAVEAWSVNVSDEGEEEAKELLLAVARTSTNGDQALAEKVLECFELVGDDGNVTIAEISGPSGYEVEAIDGYAIDMGYEESCSKFHACFVNEPETQRCVMRKPLFLLFHGRITDLGQLMFVFNQIGQLWEEKGFHNNIVVVATGFSEAVLNRLAANFSDATTLNIFPLLVPQSPIRNGQLHLLEDLSAITGAKVFGIDDPLHEAKIDDLGFGDSLTSFEVSRFRSTIIGRVDSQRAVARADLVGVQAQSPDVSELERMLMQERIGKLTGGIARLKVMGPSNVELKEKRDRAEDAICAVRGAVKNGCLPGGGWTLLRLVDILKKDKDPVVQKVLIPALQEPVTRLLSNIGLDEDEQKRALAPVKKSLDSALPIVYDALEDRHLPFREAGIVDSTPAVLEAVRNALSIAAQLGTLGGAVVFARDHELERLEAQETESFLRDARPTNLADERA